MFANCVRRPAVCNHQNDPRVPLSHPLLTWLATRLQAQQPANRRQIPKATKRTKAELSSASRFINLRTHRVRRRPLREHQRRRRNVTLPVIAALVTTDLSSATDMLKSVPRDCLISAYRCVSTHNAHFTLCLVVVLELLLLLIFRFKTFVALDTAG